MFSRCPQWIRGAARPLVTAALAVGGGGQHPGSRGGAGGAPPGGGAARPLVTAALAVVAGCQHQASRRGPMAPPPVAVTSLQYAGTAISGPMSAVGAVPAVPAVQAEWEWFAVLAPPPDAPGLVPVG